MADNAASDKDWLGYDAYAASLWRRIQQEFARHEGASKAVGATPNRLPTGDPLVVGVYGEWGAGKTRLLELVHDKVHHHALQVLGQRALDPQAYDKELSITLPVWFHPWKYEHETTLAMPLLMHISDALRVYLKDGQTFAEATTQVLMANGVTANELAKKIEKGVGLLEKGLSLTHKLLSNKVAQTVVGVAGGMVGAGEVAKDVMERAAQAVGTLAGADDDDKAKKKTTAEEGKVGDEKPPPATVPRFQADGSFYYNVHRHLRELSRITPEGAKKYKVKLTHEVRLNFVVFVDDLDRCLPEKAVQALEVIKTLLNVECFAFVVALDDEVIERGIAHRYKDYRFAGAKPEMPITGFEYLEKIIHLPFKLPQLTRAQAVQFIQRLDERLALPVPGEREDAMPMARLWFTPGTGGLRGQGEAELTISAAMPQTPPQPQPTALVNLLLDSFEAFVPRKLARAVEALHHLQRVLQTRGIHMVVGSSPVNISSDGKVIPDARLLLMCTVLQLFAPELFRLLRRRPLIWSQWMTGYLAPSSSVDAIFRWHKTHDDLPIDLQVSDALLYRWAAAGDDARGVLPQTVKFGANAVPNPGATPPPPVKLEPLPDLPEWRADLPQWMNDLAKFNLDNAARFTAEQVRLPWVRALCEYRDAQRHAFDPLRLGAALTKAMGWTAGDVAKLGEYLQLFADAKPADPSDTLTANLTARATLTGTLGAVPEVGAATAPPTTGTRDIAIPLMLEIIASKDAGTRRSLLERLGLRAGDLLTTRVWQAFAKARAEKEIKQGDAFDALVMLAPHIAPADHDMLKGAFAWPTLNRWKTLDAIPLVPATVLDVAAPLAALARLNLVHPLGLADVAERLEKALVQIAQDTTLEGEQRAAAGDLLGPFGDSTRFAFDAKRWYLPSKRRWPALPATDSTHEPIPGFVYIPAGPFMRGEKGESDNPPQVVHIKQPFYIARTLTTVDQWAAFIAAGGYDDKALWDDQGWEWSQGDYDNQVDDEGYKKRLAERPTAQRGEPRFWPDQSAFGNRAVTGVSWFEARAYCRWLSEQLQDEMTSAGLSNHEARLPLEVQWERAARAASASTADARRWPWGDDEAAATRMANIRGTGCKDASAVATFVVNPIGLYDMAGNVWQWQDNLHTGEREAMDVRVTRNKALKARGKPSDADTPALRGGSWNFPADLARCAYRLGSLPVDASHFASVRVVLSMVDSESKAPAS